MNNLGALPVFVEVVKKEGFAAAGRSLGISRSAVSKRISELEEHLGAKLLYRSTRKLSLTEAGERYYSRASEALEAAQEAEDAVFELQVKPQGNLKINVPMSFGRLHIAPLVAKFLKLHPQVEIHMIMEDRIVDLVQGGFDLAIRGGTLPDSSLVARQIAPCRNMIVASSEYLEVYGVPNTPEDLHGHNCVHYEYYARRQEWLFQGPNGHTSIKPSGNIRINNGEALITAILDGVGIGRSPTFIAGHYVLSGQLMQVLTDYQLPEQSIYVVFPDRKYMPSKVRVFIDFIVKEIGKEQPYWDEGLYSTD